MFLSSVATSFLSCLYLTRCCGFEIHVDSTFMHFMRNSVTLFRARITSTNAAYIDGTTLPASEAACTITTRPLDLQLWHERLCHHNSADIQKLISGGLAIGISLSSSEKRDPICEPCLAGKMHSSPFPSTGHRASASRAHSHRSMWPPFSFYTRGIPLLVCIH